VTTSNFQGSTETGLNSAEPSGPVLGYVIAVAADRMSLTDSSPRTLEQALAEKREWDRRPGMCGRVVVCEVRAVT
jgi:hypothetical protein